MKYEDVLKRFVSTQAQLLQEKQMRQQQREQMLAEKAQGLQSFVPGMQGHSPEEEYTESEHNPFEESQEYEDGGIHIDPSKKGTFKAQATRMGMSVQEAASHILNNKEDYTPTMVKKANFAKNFAKEEGGMFTGDYEYPDGGEFDKPRFSVGLYASPEMGSSVSPSLNFEKGKFNANVSTNIPIEMPNRYNRNLNVDANYNTGKFGNIGVSGSAYRNEEGLPAYNAGLRYEVPINDKLNFMLNADTSSFENLRDNANVSAGLRYTFEKGGDMIKRADGSYSKRGLWDNIRDNRGSGKKPTKEMLKQAADIAYREGGSFNNPGFNALPEAVQDKIIAAMMYGGSFNNNNWD